MNSAAFPSLLDAFLFPVLSRGIARPCNARPAVAADPQPAGGQSRGAGGGEGRDGLTSGWPCRTRGEGGRTCH